MTIDLEDTDVPNGRAFDALADDRRRRILSVLSESDTSLSLRTLATELVRTEQVETGADVGDDPIDRCEIELYHRHVPKLSDAGLVSFDQERRTVRLAVELGDADDAAEVPMA